MRILFSTLALLFCCGLATAQSCQSAPSVISDLNKEISKKLIKLGCAISATYQGSDTQNYNNCISDVTKYQKLTEQMVTYWNGRKNSWSTIGPRRLNFGQYEHGRLVSTGGRMYISCVPSNKNTMTVDISELDGKGKTSFVVCKVDRRGNYTQLRNGWFNDSSDRKKKTNEKRSFTISGVQGHLISIHFDGKSVGNTFQYKVRVR